MAMIRVSVEEMQSAATRCNQLSEKIAECKAECIALNNQLQSAWEGQSAAAFDEYVQGTASRVLDECSQMCAQTGQAITHTCNQFTEADGTLSSTFRV